MLRPVALFFALFGLLNLIAGWCRPGCDVNLCWIDVRFLPAWCGALILICGCAALGIYAFKIPPSRKQRLAVASAIAILAVVCFINAVTFYVLVARRTIHTSLPLPLSIVFAVLFAAVARDLIRTASSPFPRPRVWIATLVACVVLFPASQFVFFGTTDYRRNADVAVVFGCEAYANGLPSPALADRVYTACELYRDGTVSRLLFSGGPGKGAIDEPHVMRTYAMSLGVPDEAIILDSAGFNSHRTVVNTALLLRKLGPQRILAVSHFFHLSRIKLAYQRAGIDVRTVVAPQRRPMVQLPFLLVRETAAWWYYLVRY